MDKHYPYEHGIATYALGESYALAKTGKQTLPGLREAFEKGVQIILDGQTSDGGWVYGYQDSTEGDVSVTAWQYQALKAAKHTGLEFADLDKVVREAREFLEDSQGRNGGFTYRRHGGKKNENKWSLTGAGVLGLQMLGSKSESKIEKGLEYIFTGGPSDNTWHEEDPIEWYSNNGNAYAWYYHTQACYQAGGTYWERWNDIFREDLLAAQEEDGSWLKGGGSTADDDQDHFRTCAATLMLEVYYRYLPATGDVQDGI